jgi:hypothetical protein
VAAHSAGLSVALRLCVVMRFVVSIVGCCAWVRAYLRADIAIGHPEAFVVVLGVRP